MLNSVQQAFPHLHVQRPIGDRGGQKEVYLGTLDGAPVALKVIRPSTNAAARTLREIYATSSLNSDYVPRVHKYGTCKIDGDERHYIIEDFIAGRSYRSVLAGQPQQSLEQCVRVLRPLINACCDFERCDLVHRDIKPENLIVDQAGKVWVIDFGIVRVLGLQSVTPSEQPFGPYTLGYGAPEQIRNEKAKILIQADLFSVGVVGYEAILGFNPFLYGQTDQLRVMKNMCEKDLPPLSIPGDGDNDLSLFLRTLVQRFPTRRPVSAVQARNWLAEVVRKLGIGET